MHNRPRALTRIEAQQRAELLSVEGYLIDLDLTRGEEAFGSLTVVKFSCTQPGARTFVELRPTRLVAATLNGRPLESSLLVGNRLALQGLQAENELIVEADMPYSSTGEGMHRFIDPLDGETYVGAYLGVDNAQRVFANFDQPDLKATIQLKATAPASWTVVGNGAGRRTGETSETGRWEFAPTPRLSTYLMVIVAGPLHSIRRQHRGVPFAVHCRQSLAVHLDREADEIFAITHACFDRYADLFDEPYPYDSYDQAFVPELNWGAMESPGCVTFRDDFVYRSAVTDVQRQLRAMVIAHEMAHMWFGDLVTMRWWDDLWLSESFAEYMGFQILTEATRFRDTWTQFAVMTKTWGYDADQRPTTHPVAADAADVTDTERALANFDGISYAKGASAIRQLVTWLGEEAFLRGVNDFLTRYRFGVATLADLLDALSTSSGRDVHMWADRWLRSTGVDTIRMLVPADASTKVCIEHSGLRPHRVEVGLYDRPDNDPGHLVLRRRSEATLEVGTTGTAGIVSTDERRPDVFLLNDRDLSYCKVRFDPASWAVLVETLSGIDDPLSRAVVWTTARDLVRDGELPPRDYLALVSRHLPQEDDIAIVQEVVDFARVHVIDRYLATGHRKTALALLGDACRAILERPASAASDVQANGLRLAAVRGVIDSAITLDNIGDLRACLIAGTVPGGPVVDSDLRWRILLRLSILNAMQLEEIQEELARDSSGTAPEGAARCRAAIPTVATKEAAWKAIFGARGKADLSTYLVSATAQGFWQPEQPALLSPFVKRYFPAAADVAARRGASVADAVGGVGFPFHVVDEVTLRAGEKLLAVRTVNAALRRTLTDQLDDLRRALHVRRLHE